jgi:hypothetical protein
MIRIVSMIFFIKIKNHTPHASIIAQEGSNEKRKFGQCKSCRLYTQEEAGQQNKKRHSN